VREASRRAEEAASAGGDEVPPHGWDAPRSERPGVPDLQALVALLDGVRASIPPELSRQLAEALRDLLVAIRALIDWYVERLDRAIEPAPDDRAGVEDIPID
jgi:hypothetical protein